MNSQDTSSTFVLLSLGANLGDRQKSLRSAVDTIHSQGLLSSIIVSSVYETEPVGYKEQPSFLNIAVSGYSNLLPQDFHLATKRIEQDIGRTSRNKWHEREIDIDILLFGNAIINTESLHIPHPHIHERGFVLIPSNAIAPMAVHPISGKNIQQLLNECTDIASVYRRENPL